MMINVHSKYHSIKLITFGAVRLLGESSKHVNVVNGFYLSVNV